MPLPIETVHTDILVIGGGTAGCMAAITAKKLAPRLRVTVVEKANPTRSGCLAAGVNAINAYLREDGSAEDFLQYIRRENHGLVQPSLILTLASRLNKVTRFLEEIGLPFPKDKHQRYIFRGPRSIHVYGERIKPLLSRQTRLAGAELIDHVVITDLLVTPEQRVIGAAGFSLLRPKFAVFYSRAVICCTGGASGIYPSPGRSWYPPANRGSGYAMGIRAGAKMTSMEMRFVALRIASSMAPTGTITQEIPLPHRNAHGQEINLVGLTTSERLAAILRQEQQTGAPCYLDLSSVAPSQWMKTLTSYLDMCPSFFLDLATAFPSLKPDRLLLAASEPYLVGGHGMAGYKIYPDRNTTLPGLYAAGDVAGGMPKKYVSGCLAEGEIAAESTIAHLLPPPKEHPEVAKRAFQRAIASLASSSGAKPQELHRELHQIMDLYAGGKSSGYELKEGDLKLARGKLKDLKDKAKKIEARTLPELLKAHEFLDCLEVAEVAVEHLLYRRETRWPVYQSRKDYPTRDDHRWLVILNSSRDPQSGDITIEEEKLDKQTSGGMMYGDNYTVRPL